MVFDQKIRAWTRPVALTLCFGHKMPLHLWVLDRKYMLDMYFLNGTQGFVSLLPATAPATEPATEPHRPLFPICPSPRHARFSQPSCTPFASVAVHTQTRGGTNHAPPQSVTELRVSGNNMFPLSGQEARPEVSPRWRNYPVASGFALDGQ